MPKNRKSTADPEYVPAKVPKIELSSDVICAICNGSKGPMEVAECNRIMQSRGLKSLLDACSRHEDDAAASRIRELKEQPEKLKFHNTCRVNFVHGSSTSRQQTHEEASVSGQQETQYTPVLRSQVSPFCSSTQCFVCGQAEDPCGNGDTLISATKKPAKIWDDVLYAAQQRNDQDVQQRLRLNISLRGKVVRYHKIACYQLYINSRNVKAAQNKNDNKDVTDTVSLHNRVGASLATHLWHSLFQKKEILFLANARQKYVDLLIDEGADDVITDNVTSTLVKAKLVEAFGQQIVFFDDIGQSDIFCSVDVTVQKLKAVSLISDGDGSTASPLSDDMILHRAAEILRRKMDDVPATSEYPCSDEVSLDHSEELLPTMLARFIQLLVDPEALPSRDLDSFISDEATRRMYVAISESILYCSRKKYAAKVLPPLQMGLMIQLHHQFGSRSLIDTLHAHGFCASYEELRLFLSSAARQNIDQAKDGAYIPPELVSRDQDRSCIIHEGNDNIDVNVQTIDGKNTYHSMARVIFQDRLTSMPAAHVRVKRPSKPDSKCRSLEESCEAPFTKPLLFNKPKVKPEFERCDEAPSRMEEYGKQNRWCVRDLSWCLLRNRSRQSADHRQIIPFWTGFNAMNSQPNETVTVTTYAPTIEAPPTNMGTVYTVLKRGQEVTAKLGQPYQVHTFDQQLYAIAQQVKWSRPEEFPRLTIRMGGFHTLSTFNACIGKIWGDSGLKDLLVESGVYAANTAEHMLNGHQFHRAVRGLTLCFEVLMVRFVDALLQWAVEQQHVNTDPSDSLDEVVMDTRRRIEEEGEDPASAMKKLDDMITERVLSKLGSFREWGTKKSPTFKHWLDCLDALQLLLNNIRAEREANWKLHLATVIGMLPYFFVCNRQNYSRWASIYVLEMISKLPDEVAAAFDAGQFTVKRSAGTYNGIWSDMGVECTVIKDSKIRSGIVGITGRGTSVLRWSVTRHLVGRYAQVMQERSGTAALSPDATTHKQQKPSMMSKDEKHAQQMLSHLKNNFIDPFAADEHPECLVNISTGLNATDDVQKSLLAAITTGKKACDSYVKERLSTTGKKSIWDPIRRSGLTTFASMNKPTKMKIGSKKVLVAVSAEVVFRRALTLAAHRPDVNLNTILSRPISATPTALFKETGTRQTTAKAELIHWLEGHGKTIYEVPKGGHNIYIVDGMADVQPLSGNRFRTFQDLGESFLQDAISLLDDADEVHIVYDRYDEEDSVKAEERESRLEQCSSAKIYTVVASSTIPPWRKFLGSLKNKEALVEFLSKFLTETTEFVTAPKLANKRLYVGGGFKDRETAKYVSSNGLQCCDDLKAAHEEADTRIIFHLMNADSRMVAAGLTDVRAIVKTPDTDVICLAIHFFCKLSAITEVWIHTGRVGKTTDRVRYIPIHEICQKIGPVICNILPGVHALTGCDSVSSLYFIGKNTVMNMIWKYGGDEFSDLVALGHEDEDAVVAAARKFLIALYDPQKKQRVPPLQDLNDLRVRLARRSDQSLARLPPCEVSFLQHVRRAAWQTRLWMLADQPSPMTVSPIGHGWHKEDGILRPVYFHGETASEVLDDLVCSCRKGSKCENCSCSTSGLACVDLCSCKAGESCGNPMNQVVLEDSSDMPEGLDA